MITQPPDYLFADSLLAACVEALGPALAEQHAAQSRHRAKSAEPPAYRTSLPGVTYDRSSGKLQCRITWRVAKKQYQHWLGSGPPTWEEELRLHGLWLAAKEERQ